jgi:hypothetical protein
MALTLWTFKVAQAAMGNGDQNQVRHFSNPVRVKFSLSMLARVKVNAGRAFRQARR